MNYKLTNGESVIRLDGAFVSKLNTEYLQWLSEGNIPEPAAPMPNPHIVELKAELAALDIKRIRPTAEGDVAYLAILNAQAVALRAELQALL